MGHRTYRVDVVQINLINRCMATWNVSVKKIMDSWLLAKQQLVNPLKKSTMQYEQWNEYFFKEMK